MEETIFNQSFNVVWFNGAQIKYEYFLLDGVPIIDYSGSERSVCGKIPLEKWSSYDGLFPNGTPAIFLNVGFDKEINWCTLYHELGHIKMGHLDQEQHEERLIGIDKGIVSPDELEADGYTLKMMGKEKTLRWLNWLLDTTERKIYYFEFMERERESGLCEEEKQNLQVWRQSNKEVILRLKAIEDS